MKTQKPSLTIHKPVLPHKSVAFPHFLSRVPAGFPSPAEDFEESKLNLDKHLIKHPHATFFVTVSGNSMEGRGIFSGDLLVVDRSLEARSGDVVIAAIEGELTVKTLHLFPNRIELQPENSAYKPIIIEKTQDIGVIIWGVVTSVIHRFRQYE